MKNDKPVEVFPFIFSFSIDRYSFVRNAANFQRLESRGDRRVEAVTAQTSDQRQNVAVNLLRAINMAEEEYRTNTGAFAPLERFGDESGATGSQNHIRPH
jgi:hypothetical protein